MLLKAGVSISGLKTEILFALIIAKDIYNTYGYTLVVTSGLEGAHKRGSLHYLGYAVDIRIRDIDTLTTKKLIVENLKDALGGGFDIVLHKTHIHMEFNPKKGANQHA